MSKATATSNQDSGWTGMSPQPESKPQNGAPVVRFYEPVVTMPSLPESGTVYGAGGSCMRASGWDEEGCDWPPFNGYAQYPQWD